MRGLGAVRVTCPLHVTLCSQQMGGKAGSEAHEQLPVAALHARSCLGTAAVRLQEAGRAAERAGQHGPPLTHPRVAWPKAFQAQLVHRALPVVGAARARRFQRNLRGTAKRGGSRRGPRPVRSRRRNTAHGRQTEGRLGGQPARTRRSRLGPALAYLGGVVCEVLVAHKPRLDEVVQHWRHGGVRLQAAAGGQGPLWDTKAAGAAVKTGSRWEGRWWVGWVVVVGRVVGRGGAGIVPCSFVHPALARAPKGMHLGADPGTAQQPRSPALPTQDLHRDACRGAQHRRDAPVGAQQSPWARLACVSNR